MALAFKKEMTKWHQESCYVCDALALRSSLS